MTQEIQRLQTPFLDQIKENAGVAIAVGAIVMLIGLLVMASPMVAGISVAMMVGVMLVISGIAQLVFAFKSGSGIFAIILGVLTVLIGGYMVSNLDVALTALTIFLAAYLVASGISEALMSFQARPARGWAWALFSGILSVVLGIMIWAQAPLSGAWAIGILIGIKLFFSGWALLMFGFAARGAAKA